MSTYTLNSLKKSSNIDKLSQELAKMNEKGSGQGKNADAEEYWTLSVDKAGNGHAVIRFLPAAFVDGEDGLPWVRYWDHGFQHPKSGKWYIENSLTTLGHKDPVSEYNRELWATGIQANRDFVQQKSKRRLHYVSNILVVEDSKNPSAEGKVFKFRYGAKIMDKISEKMNPEFEDETRLNPFDMNEGANFKLKAKMVAGYRNYDKSEFEDSSALFDGDENKQEELWKKEYSLLKVVAADKFKSYDELKTRFDSVMGFAGGETPQAAPKTTETQRRVNKSAEAEDGSRLEETSKPTKSTDKEDNTNYDAFFAGLNEE